MGEDAQKKYIQRAESLNEQRERARAQRLKRKAASAPSSKVDEVIRTDALEYDCEGQMDPATWTKRFSTPGDLVKKPKINAMSTSERQELIYLDGTPCIPNGEIMLRIIPDTKQKTL